jgi:polyribonucleotide nucleotidyltransferase
VEETAASDLDLIVVTRNTEAVMLEAEGKEIPEDALLAAIAEGTTHASAIAGFVSDIARELGTAKAEPITSAPPAELAARVRASARERAEAIVREGGAKLDMEEKFSALAADLVKELKLPEDEAGYTSDILHGVYGDIVREWIINEGKRVNGRAPDEVRPLRIEVGVVPRAHGSALFQRGETQILSVVTLGAPDDAMILDTMTEEDTKKRYLHFYNMPAFSVGEIAPNRGPGRRDIGHGALAEKALERLLPTHQSFSYTVVVVSEVLSSNGSSSMGSACGSSLALFDAGVPLPAAVAGIAMGLVTDKQGKGRRPVVLTDIAGMEDEGCDMDFKVAGTRTGVTAMQVDIKIHGLTPEVIAEAMRGARQARLHILDAMDAVIREPRKEMSPFAPRILSLQIKPERIADLIGPRGKHINRIIEETKNVKLNAKT